MNYIYISLHYKWSTHISPPFPCVSSCVAPNFVLCWHLDRSMSTQTGKKCIEEMWMSENFTLIRTFFGNVLKRNNKSGALWNGTSKSINFRLKMINRHERIFHSMFHFKISKYCREKVSLSFNKQMIKNYWMKWKKTYTVCHFFWFSRHQEKSLTVSYVHVWSIGKQ